MKIEDLKLSKEYFIGVEEGRRHHASNKTYSGKLLRPHKPFLTEMVERLGAQSALDYGAGKGDQWTWVDPADGKTIEQVWGFPVAKYDPCWPPFAAEPEGTYDLVICTHTLALIPVVDLPKIMARLYAFANKGVFIAEKIGERKKGEVADPKKRAINWTARDWLGWVGGLAIGRPKIETVLSTREQTARGVITTRHIWRDGQYLGAQEAAPRG